MSKPDPVDLHRPAAADALQVASGVRSDQLGLPRPCSDWTVPDLLDRVVGGTRYLAATEPSAPAGATAADFRAGIEACLRGLSKTRPRCTGSADRRWGSNGRCWTPRRERSWTC